MTTQSNITDSNPCQLMTSELVERFRQIGCQENKKNPLVITKYFNPWGSQNWYATEYDPETRLFFGYVSLFGDYCDEWGYFSLDELQTPIFCELCVKGKIHRMKSYIERDLYFKENHIRECLKEDGLKANF